jgi:hypothetical protein
MIKIGARVRGLFAGNYPDNREDEQVHINNRGDSIWAQGLPFLTELVRLGDSWQVQTATAIAALTGYPTTVAALSLWNGEPGNGKCYVIDSIGCFEVVVDATQSDMTALFASIDLNIAAPTDAAMTIRSLSGKLYGGRARTTVNAATTSLGFWYPHGPSVPLAPVNTGSGWKQQDTPLNGMYIVPPGGRFGVHAVKVAAAATQMQFFIRFHEVQLIIKS